LALRWCLGTDVRLVALAQEKLGPLFRGATTSELALLSILAGVAEEALFRGVIQTALAGPLPPWPAAVVAGLLFGVVHWVSAGYAAVASVAGIYLGALFLLTGDLLVPIVAHALYDFAALSILIRLKPAPAASVV
jgi:membrane protease YdiL (CAAX protease family)